MSTAVLYGTLYGLVMAAFALVVPTGRQIAPRRAFSWDVLMAVAMLFWPIILVTAILRPRRHA